MLEYVWYYEHSQYVMPAHLLCVICPSTVDFDDILCDEGLNQKRVGRFKFSLHKFHITLLYLKLKLSLLNTWKQSII
jgi:predicted nucleic acid-binding Zn ribbon protein